MNSPRRPSSSGLIVRRHLAKGALGAGAVAAKLRRLCGKQQRERLLRRDLPGVFRVTPRGASIAGANRDQPAHDCALPARIAPVAERGRDTSRRMPQAAQDRPEQHAGRDHREDHGRQHHQRGFDPPAEPDHRHFARAIREPGDAERDQAYDCEKDCNTDHRERCLTIRVWRAPTAPIARATAPRRCAALRASAFLIQSSAGARASGGSLASSVSAPRISALPARSFDARLHARRIVADRLARGTDAHDLFGIGLQPFEEAAFDRLARARRLPDRRHGRGQFAAETRSRRHAALRKRLERCNRLRIARKRAHRRAIRRRRVRRFRPHCGATGPQSRTGCAHRPRTWRALCDLGLVGARYGFDRRQPAEDRLELGARLLGSGRARLLRGFVGGGDGARGTLARFAGDHGDLVASALARGGDIGRGFHRSLGRRDPRASVAGRARAALRVPSPACRGDRAIRREPQVRGAGATATG